MRPATRSVCDGMLRRRPGVDLGDRPFHVDQFWPDRQVHRGFQFAGMRHAAQRRFADAPDDIGDGVDPPVADGDGGRLALVWTTVNRATISRNGVLLPWPLTI